MTALYIVLVGVVVMLGVGFALALAMAAKVGDEIFQGWDHDHDRQWWKDQP
jgi:hypothetical protein